MPELQIDLRQQLSSAVAKILEELLALYSVDVACPPAPGMPATMLMRWACKLAMYQILSRSWHGFVRGCSLSLA
jgi:hypothetical protein